MRLPTLAAVTMCFAAFCSSASAALINIDFNGSTDSNPGTATQSGAAVLGVAGDTWNHFDLIQADKSKTISTIVDSNNQTLAGVSASFTSNAGSYNADGGTARDAATDNLMRDYVYSYTGNADPDTVTMDIAGLSAYNGQAFTLVVYAAGDTSGQGASLTLTGATDGNSSSTLLTSATSRKISDGLGVAYQTFTGTINAGTLTITANVNGADFTAINGAQLSLIPEPSSFALLLFGSVAFGMLRRKKS